MIGTLVPHRSYVVALFNRRAPLIRASTDQLLIVAMPPNSATTIYADFFDNLCDLFDKLAPSVILFVGVYNLKDID